VIHPIRIDKQSPFLGEECALCKELLSPGDLLVVCPQDGTRHHLHCWQANGNRCTAYGCAGAGEVATNPSRERPTIIEQQPEELDTPPGRHRETAISPPEPATTERAPDPVTDHSPTASRTTTCGQGCILLAIALAIVLISIACFGLWAMADYIFLEILEWNYRLP
jgi:hypothetical protein